MCVRVWVCVCVRVRVCVCEMTYADDASFESLLFINALKNTQRVEKFAKTISYTFGYIFETQILFLGRVEGSVFIVEYMGGELGTNSH